MILSSRIDSIREATREEVLSLVVEDKGSLVDSEVETAVAILSQDAVVQVVSSKEINHSKVVRLVAQDLSEEAVGSEGLLASKG